MRTCVLICTILLLVVVTTHGKIYKWRDDQGKPHFTDNIAAVPPAYRHQVEERDSTPAPSQSSQQGATAPGQQPPAEPQGYTIQLYGNDNNLFVDTVLNKTVTARLQVDTGATYTVISRKLAQQLRLDANRADILPISTANGVVLASLTTLDVIAVGDAAVQNIDVIVHDAGRDGLLGMSFLSNFQVAINSRDGKMTLTPLDAAAGTESYGGRSEQWWKSQFAFYRTTIADTKNYLQQRSMSKADRAGLEKALGVFQQKLTALEHKASRAAVPRHWRY